MSEDFLLEEWHDVGLKSDGTTKTNDSGLGVESSAGARLGDRKEETSESVQNKTLVPTIRTLNRQKQRNNATKAGLPLKSNGNLALKSPNAMTTSEAAKLLDISSDSSESDLNLEIPPPKRKVRFKRKFRVPSRASKTKVTNSQEASSCSSCYCSNSLALFGFLILSICSISQIWFHYNLSSRVDGIQKQYNTKPKLDPTSRLDVSFRSCKKMKKRKELDALVQGQKLGKRPPSKKSQPRSENKVSAHHLLGNDSESSDLDDFTIINSQRSNGKKSGATSSLCAASCLPLCLMVLVTTLIVALGTILWLHLGLREDLDLIRAHLQKVEAQSKETPEALHDYHIQLKNLEFNVTTFAEELKKINSEIISINEAVRQLKSTTASLKESIAAAPEMKTLPNDFKEITGTVVNLGSKITQLEANVKELKTTQTELKNSAQSLQHGQEEIKGNVTSLIQMKEEISSNKDIISRSETSFKDSLMAQVYKEIHHVQELFDELNSTVMPKISNLTEWGSRINEMNESLVWAVSDLSSLHAFVYSNLTSMMRQVQSESTPGDASPLVEQTVLKILTDALNNNSPDQSGSNWKHLLREACRMVNIYADVFKNLSQPINGASSLIEHMVVDFERLNDTIHHLEMSESQTATFQSSVNQTFSQLRDQMNSFSIQLALIKSGRPTSSQSSINARIMETTSNPITTTITSVKKPATNPVPIPTQDLRSPISNRNIHKTESILKRALGGF